MRSPARLGTLAIGLFISLPALAAAPAAEATAPAVRKAPALQERLLGEVDSPRALADLYRLWERRDRSKDLTSVAGTLEKVAKAPKARPDVKATALELRSQLALAQGQVPQARAVADEIAPLREWAIIGPFDNEGRGGLFKEYPPERDGYDPAARYPGKDHEVAWRTPPQLAAFGYVDLSSAVTPRQNVTIYAATNVRADRARAVIFHLGASGASKVWLNGELINEDSNEHPSRWDQKGFAAQLRKGDNALLVKLAHSAGKPGFSLRLADEKDAPLVAVARAAKPVAGKAASALDAPSAEGTPKVPPRLPDVLDAVADLEKLAARYPEDARIQEDLGILFAYRRPDDDTDRRAVKALEKASAALPGDAYIELRLSRLQDKDVNKRREAIERAVEKNPDDVDALCALAGYRLERGDGWQALGLAERAREKGPKSLFAAQTLGRALDAVGLSARATKLRIDAGQAAPDSIRGHRLLAQALRRVSRIDDAMAALRWSLQQRFDDGEARAELISVLLDRGDLDGALKLVADAQLLDPASVQPKLRAAELLSQNGRYDAADAAYKAAVELAPDDPDVREAVGRHELRRGDEKKALEAFNASLELKPQNPALRELVRSVKADDNYAQAYLYDAAALYKEANTELAAPVEDDLEVLADLSVTRVFANGLSSRTRQLVVRVLTQRGVDAARYQAVQYSPDRQVVKVERARILRKDGTVLESKSEGERNLSEPWSGLYYDVRARTVGFPQLQPGDAIELVTRTDDAGGSNLFADYFGDFAYLQSTWRKRIADYVLLGPPGRTFYAKATPLPTLKHTEGKLPDGGAILRWTATDVPRLVPEPGMPGTSELLAHVHVSTYKDWDSVGRFYWGLVKDQLRVTDEIRTAANEVVKDVPAADELGRIRALYNFVVSRTRYVGLEFGIHSFKPYAVDAILSRKFGDCKDKASLLHALLESVGIDSRLTLLRTRPKGAIEAEPASLAVFDHAILYVPKYKLFLDGTAEFHGSQELPASDRGAEVLVVEPSDKGGSQFFRVPEAKPEDNADEARGLVKLSQDGAASFEIDSTARGTWTAELRRSFESPDSRTRLAEEQLSRALFPGVKVDKVDVSDPHDIEKPFATKFTAQVAGFATKAAAGALRFRPFGQRGGYVETYAQLSQRALPQRLSAPYSQLVHYEIELPQGFSASLPEDVSEQSEQGAFALHYKLDGSHVVADLNVQLRGGSIQPKDYPAFRAFLSRLDAALQRQVEAAPARAAKVETADGRR
jgi:tetratricopeptide (TPR) repeat protein